MLQEKEEYKVPNLFRYLGYTIFFWANENFEPIHVHNNYFYIISEWKNFHGVDNIKFYC